MKPLNDRFPSLEELSEANKALLELDDEIRTALIQGIEKKKKIFQDAGIFPDLQHIQVTACRSRVLLLHLLRKQVRANLMIKSQGRPNTGQLRIARTLRQSLIDWLYQYTKLNS